MKPEMEETVREITERDVNFDPDGGFSSIEEHTKKLYFERISKVFRLLTDVN